ncbi:MAG: hypothetical protein FWC50_03145 [Planctomycetaceae bacterium]|nr:hypothetical protein [Planctomycetaceae bacterium]
MKTFFWLLIVCLAVNFGNARAVAADGLRFEPARFDPERRLASPLQMAVQIRSLNGFREGDDFSFADALAMGKALRKEWPSPVTFDEKQLAANGIRVIKSRHLLLCTDVPPSPEVDELPAVFDLAVVEYCRYFGTKLQDYDDWLIQGFLIADVKKFQTAGLIGPYPTKLNGFSIDRRLWVKDQTSAYLRRHLLIHEGVHGFMNWTFGTCGPPWYMEAVAEYLGTHTWQNGKLTLGVMPENREAFPSWGRIDLLKKSVRENKIFSLDKMMRISADEIVTPADYAWVWALGTLLDNHPRYQNVFRAMPRLLTFPDFTNRFYLQLAKQWGKLQLDWLDTVANIEYDYDMQRTVIDAPPDRLTTSPVTSNNTALNAVTFEVDAARGWQCGGVTVQSGKTYRITASGRYQLAKEPKIWWSEPNGVTVRYHHGKPLGILMAGVIPEELFSGRNDVTANDVPFFAPLTVGTETTVTLDKNGAFGKSGTLWFRINDSAAELWDNSGTCRVTVVEVQPDVH